MDAAVVLPNRQDLQELVATEVGAEACQKDAELQRYHAASVAHLEHVQNGGPTVLAARGWLEQLCLV
jgi:hypothetical protein